MVLGFSVKGKAYAEEPPPMSYDEYLKQLRKIHGVEFTTPISRFELVVKDSAGNIKEKIFVDENKRAEFSILKGQTMKDIEVKETIFETINNYAVSNLKVSPRSVYAGENGYTTSMPVTLTFNLTHETVTDKANMTSYPVVEIRQGTKVIKTVNVLVEPNKTVPVSIAIPSTKYPKGSIPFTIEVNPKRTEIETKGTDPYKDNVATTSMTVNNYVTGCIDCTNYRTSNTWTERFYFTEQKGTVRSSSAYVTWCKTYGWETDYYYEYVYNPKTGLYEEVKKEYQYYTCKTYEGAWVPYTYCSVNSYRSWTTDKTFSESYKIDKVMFQSKWSKDNYGGWIDIKNDTIESDCSE
jgi:hypothetical protein